MFLTLSHDNIKNTHLAPLHQHKVQTLTVSESPQYCLSLEKKTVHWIKMSKFRKFSPKIQDFQVKIEEKSRENAVAQFPLVIQNY